MRWEDNTCVTYHRMELATPGEKSEEEVKEEGEREEGGREMRRKGKRVKKDKGEESFHLL